MAYLKATVQSIVDAIVSTQRTLRAIYPQLNTVPDLVPEVTFITTQELEDRYPELTPKEREKPEIIGASRKKRIAAGSGTKVEDVNRLLKQFDQTCKMMKELSGGKFRRMMKKSRKFR